MGVDGRLRGTHATAPATQKDITECRRLRSSLLEPEILALCGPAFNRACVANTYSTGDRIKNILAPSLSLS